jgi:hypothetical protein
MGAQGAAGRQQVAGLLALRRTKINNSDPPLTAVCTAASLACRRTSRRGRGGSNLSPDPRPNIARWLLVLAGETACTAASRRHGDSKRPYRTPGQRPHGPAAPGHHRQAAAKRHCPYPRRVEGRWWHRSPSRIPRESRDCATQDSMTGDIATGVLSRQ